MKTYDDIRDEVQNGDIVLCKDRDPIGIFLRVTTGESFNHVVEFFWMGEGLMIAEMSEGIGYRIVPASQWFAQRKGELLWGIAPKEVRGSPLIYERISTKRALHTHLKYGYLSLFFVWLSQILDRYVRGAPVHWVCSTSIQDDWEFAGYDKFTKLADPGNFIRHCERLVPVQSSQR